MLEKYNENSNDKKQIDIFLNSTLSKLGLNHANLGTRYFKEIIKLAYFNNFTDVKYKDLCFMLSKQLNVSIRKININIYNSINSINIALAKKNFIDIFNMDFDYFYISPKRFTILFLNLLYNIF